MTREERVRIYTYRAERQQDLFTGEPVPDADADDSAYTMNCYCLNCGERKKTKRDQEKSGSVAKWRNVLSTLYSRKFVGRECPQCSAIWDQYHGDIEAEFQSIQEIAR